MADDNKNEHPFKARIASAKQRRDDFLTDWQTNVDYRRGKPFAESSDTDRVAVNKDWSMTKSKRAQLFSQVPKARLTEKSATFAPAVPVFAKHLNDRIDTSGVGAAMNEVLPDVINAAGIGGAIVVYEAITEDVEVPTIDPSMLTGMDRLAYLAGQFKIPTVKVPRVTDRRFKIERISPADLLAPFDEFEGSDFNDAPWVGRSGRKPWADAKREFKLSDEDKELVCGSGKNTIQRLNSDTRARLSDKDMVEFDEVYYLRHCYHEDEKSFTAIQRVVFVNGIDDKPVIDEPWSGQMYLPGPDGKPGRYIGACKRPVQFLTLEYLSDECIPPSDSAIGRPQVNELIEARTQMLLQRRHSTPLRWFNTDAVDASIHALLKKGTWQGFIPVEGNGQTSIGEVARASYPRENFDFDRIAKADLQEVWSLGPNQMGNFASGERSASEANIVAAAFQTEIGYQRAQVQTFFVNLVEVLAGLVALYDDFELPALSEQDQQRLQAWDRRSIANEFVYTIRADSTVLLSVEQRIANATDTLNRTMQTGFVNPEYLVREILELRGYDPDVVMVKPQPKGPDQVNLSIRKAEDLHDPLVLAVLMKTGQAPSPEDLNAAKLLLMESMQPPADNPQPGVPGGGVPGGMLTDGLPREPQTPDIAFPDAGLAPRIDKRRAE